MRSGRGVEPEVGARLAHALAEHFHVTAAAPDRDWSWPPA